MDRPLRSLIIIKENNQLFSPDFAICICILITVLTGYYCKFIIS